MLVIRVLIAVADPVAAIGLRAILEGSGSCECETLVPDLEEVRDAVGRHRPDVVLLDVAFRKADASLVPELAERYPESRVLVYVDHSPDECAVRTLLCEGGRVHLAPEAVARLDDCCLMSLQNMARGCLGTGSDAAAVVKAVTAVAGGEIAAAPWLGIVANTLAGAREGVPEAISVRELEVMTFLARGMTNKGIAKEMGLREQTVKNHVTKIMVKLGVENRLEAGLMASEHHLTAAD